MFGEVLSFCQLDYPQEFKSAIDSFEFESSDYKWKEQLTPLQQQQLEAVLDEHLSRWGFVRQVAGRVPLLDGKSPDSDARRAA